MNKLDIFTKGKVISSYLLFECDLDDNVIIFENFEDAKKYQDDNGVNGRVVPLPLY